MKLTMIQQSHMPSQCLFSRRSVVDSWKECKFLKVGSNPRCEVVEDVNYLDLVATEGSLEMCTSKSLKICHKHLKIISIN